MNFNKLNSLINYYFKLSQAQEVINDLQIYLVRIFLQNFIPKASVQSITKEDLIQWLHQNKINPNIFKEGMITFSNHGKNYYQFNHQGKGYIFSTSSSPPEISEQEEIKFNYLNCPQAMPQLYLWDKTRLSKASQLDVLSSHNFYILEALEYISGLNLEHDSFLNAAVKFVHDNIDKINKIRSLCQYSPRKLDQGMEGVVFSISDNLVLKIFTNQSSFQAAQEAQYRLYHQPEIAKTEANIYDVGVLGELTLPTTYFTVYYYVMEKMKPVKSLANEYPHSYLAVNKIIAQVQQEVWENEKMFTSLTDFYNAGMTQRLREELQSQVERLRHQPKISLMADQVDEEMNTNLRPSWLPSLIQEVLMKNVIGRIDLHMGNIGVTSYGEFRFFDD